MTEAELRGLLAEYLTLIGGHPSAEEFMAALLTEEAPPGRGLPKRIDERCAQLNAYSS
jgi:hypothetical protein